MKEKIKKILSLQFHPLYLEVLDESDRHASHPGARGGGGHFLVTLVSEIFEQKNLMERHRLVYASLGDYFDEKMKSRGHGIHALALNLFSPQEWEQKSGRKI